MKITTKEPSGQRQPTATTASSVISLSKIARRLGRPSSSCKQFTAANGLEYVQVGVGGRLRFYLLQGNTLTRVTQPQLEKKLRLIARERWIRPRRRFVVPRELLQLRLRLLSEQMKERLTRHRRPA